VVLNALDRVTDLNVVSSPQLVVLNNNVATLQVGDQVPVVTAQAVNVASDQTLINTIQFIDTGVILRVKPRVNASGLVTLELEQEVSDPIGAGLTPTINQRRIQSTVAVQDGETIALGGLIRDRRSKARNGIPGLSDIPIVGHAFSTTDRTDARTELLVLITPRVIRNRAEARRITEELRRRVRALEGLDSRIR
jgi:general secretion pathway protein D